MDDRASPARLRMDVSGRRTPARRERRSLIYPVLIAVAIGVVFLTSIIPPGPRIVLELGIRWLVGLGWVAVAVLAWRQPLQMWRMPAWLVCAACAAWFLARAFTKTQAAPL